jgi:16S rRNA (adenine1518-N6/adenine1519-N6)-dimethyltransferase
VTGTGPRTPPKDPCPATRDARAVLREHNLVAKKSFGQNFLVAEGVTRRIAEACVPEEEFGTARVVELGAGLGALTSRLIARARKVTAIERDRDLVPILARAFESEIAQGKLALLEGDAQTADLPALLGPPDPASPRVLCGNLPYQITGRLLERTVHAASGLERAVFMLQDEVADRLLACPATKEYGALTVFVRAAFDTSRVMTVQRSAFHPAPEVTSAVVRLVPARRAEETAMFRALVRAAFAKRRKTLRNAWREVGPMERVASAATAAGISLDARGETLDVDAFARMATALET